MAYLDTNSSITSLVYILGYFPVPIALIHDNVYVFSVYCPWSTPVVHLTKKDHSMKRLDTTRNRENSR